MTTTIHHLDTSRSHRIVWMLEELGTEYELREHTRNPKTLRAPEEMTRLHPLGKAPIVELDDGRVVAESGAIIEELVELHGGALRPEPGTDEHRRYRYFLHYAEGSFMPPLLVKLIFDQLRNAPVPFFLKPIPRAIAKKVDDTYTDGEIRTHLEFLERELKSRPYIAGDEFTAADIQLMYPVEAARSRFGLGSRYPSVEGYRERMVARPAYQRALDRGGPVIPGRRKQS